MHMCHQEAQLPRGTQRSPDMFMVLILALGARRHSAELLAELELSELTANRPRQTPTPLGWLELFLSHISHVHLRRHVLHRTPPCPQFHAGKRKGSDGEQLEAPHNLCLPKSTVAKATLLSQLAL